jgi:hypothetical protein
MTRNTHSTIHLDSAALVTCTKRTPVTLLVTNWFIPTGHVTDR